MDEKVGGMEERTWRQMKKNDTGSVPVTNERELSFRRNVIYGSRFRVKGSWLKAHGEWVAIE